MLTTGHTKIDAILTTYRTILAETTDSLAGAQGEIAALTADLAAARASLEATTKELNESEDRSAKLQEDLMEKLLPDDTLVGQRPIPDPELSKTALAPSGDAQ